MKTLRKLKPVKRLALPGKRTTTQRNGRTVNYTGKKDQRLHLRRTMKTHPPGTPLDTPCRLWQGAVDKNGYGTMKRWIDGKRYTYKTHRWIVELARGGQRLRPDQVILHLCDNPPCFRLDHLKIGTLQENNADMFAKGRNVLPPSRQGIKGEQTTTWAWHDPERRRIVDEAMLDPRWSSVPFKREVAERCGVNLATVYRYAKYMKEKADAHHLSEDDGRDRPDEGHDHPGV